MLTFQQVYETYLADVYRFTFWLTGNRLDAEDLTSETFVRAWSSAATIRTETLKAYLLAIARNLYLEQMRKGKRIVPLEDFFVDPRAEPQTVALQRAELRELQSKLAQFPEMDRAAFLLRYQHDLSYAEIARVLGISESLAKVKVHRTRFRLIQTTEEAS